MICYRNTIYLIWFDHHLIDSRFQSALQQDDLLTFAVLTTKFHFGFTSPFWKMIRIYVILFPHTEISPVKGINQHHQCIIIMLNNWGLTKHLPDKLSLSLFFLSFPPTSLSFSISSSCHFFSFSPPCLSLSPSAPIPLLPLFFCLLTSSFSLSFCLHHSPNFLLPFPATVPVVTVPCFSEWEAKLHPATECCTGISSKHYSKL